MSLAHPLSLLIVMGSCLCNHVRCEGAPATTTRPTTAFLRTSGRSIIQASKVNRLCVMEPVKRVDTKPTTTKCFTPSKISDSVYMERVARLPLGPSSMTVFTETSLLDCKYDFYLDLTISWRLP